MRESDLTARGPALQRQADGSDGNDDDEAVAGVAGSLPLVPDGWYEAKYIGHETAVIFMQPKCFLHFQIVQPGSYMGTRLFRAYRVNKLPPSRRGKGGRFVPHLRGDLYALLAHLLDIERVDRISLRPLRSMLFRIQTRTVVTNSKQKQHPEHCRYSVIETIGRQQ